MKNLCVPSAVLDIVPNLTRLVVWDKFDDIVLKDLPLQTELSVLEKENISISSSAGWDKHLRPKDEAEVTGFSLHVTPSSTWTLAPSSPETR